ncbi:MAG: hypothetical protein MUF48_20580 [Pirellulaceae bacterium]|jgi:hypothetical protein|nr:hypothetical protein [Pirellulaceae bacterium]
MAQDALAEHLGAADQPDVEVRMVDQESVADALVGTLELVRAAADGSRQTSTHRFRVEFHEDGTVRTCSVEDEGPTETPP